MFRVRNAWEVLVKEMEPEAGLREVVHQRVRLGVLAVLDRRGRSTFTQLRDALGQSDGSLSRHLGVLEEHGYIVLEKVFENRRPRTWASLTDAGVQALREEQTLLSKLLAEAADTVGPEEDPTGAVTIAFAALLADEEAGQAQKSQDPQPDVPHSMLVPAEPEPVRALGGRLLAQGPISARYEFPPTHREFGEQQRAQRLMFVSHGLRGGWVTSWQTHGEQDALALTTHAMVVGLGSPDDAEAILAVMGPSSLAVDDVPRARGYLVSLAQAELGAALSGAHQASAVAWFAVGSHLAMVVISGDRDAAAKLLEPLAAALYDHLREVVGFRR